MKRKEFIKKGLLSGAAALLSTKMVKAKDQPERKSTYDRLMEPIGFNHLPADKAGLPNQEQRTMSTVLHKAATRGHANHGWLDSHHTFSFANYHNPERMHFGVLRVLNDDIVAEGRGFGTHPHDNMEIISIPLEGDLEHKDSMNNTAVIRQGDIQVMSAGTGIFHSEYNKNQDQPVKFLQIWMFPNQRNVEPRYDQITLNPAALKNQFHQILSPSPKDEGVWVHQNAWFHLGQLDQGTEIDYAIKNKGNGVYAFIIEGAVAINGQALEARDGFGVWNTDTLKVVANANARVLLMDVPMQLN